MSSQAPDEQMIALFRTELAEATRLLALWLQRGHAAHGQPVPEDVRRAVRAVNGAARVIGVDRLGQLAAALVACLEAWPELPRAVSQAAFQHVTSAHAYLERLSRAESTPQVYAELTQTELETLELSLQVLEGRSASETGVTLRAPAEEPIVDASLFDLFRIEVESCASILSDGLVTLETQAPTEPLWEQLMRAAHSVKGAARIVELKSIAQLAHVLEDCFVRARTARRILIGDEIDVMLHAVDAISSAASLGSQPTEDDLARVEAGAQAAIQALAALGTGAMPIPRERIEAKPVVVVVDAAPKLTLIAEPTASEAPPTAAASASRAPQESVRPQERVLRVAAESISRLMGLASESLVESRRMASLSPSLMHAKKHHSLLLDVLDTIEKALGDGAHTFVVDAKTRVRECMRVLGDHATDLDSHARRAEELGERLYREALKSQMRPFGDGTHGFPRLVRDLSRHLGKRARLEIAGQNTEVDRDALDALEAPINHLLRNALDHGVELPEHRARQNKPEVAVLSIEARHHAGMLSITVSDDGSGIDVEAIRAKVVDAGSVTQAVASTLSAAELFEFLFLPGFSTARSLSEISGRGVGLDVVKSSVEALGGTVRVSSVPQQRTSFHLQLPVTRSVVRALVTSVDGDAFAFPLLRIERIERLPASQVRTLENRRYFLVDGQAVALCDGRAILGAPSAESSADDLSIVVVGDRKQRYGIVVDEFRGEHDLVVRPLDSRLGKVQDIAAAAVLMDGSPALIMDVDDLVRSIERLLQAGGRRSEPVRARKRVVQRKRVLVVDDSIAVREAQRQLLVNRGYIVDVAVDGVDGLNAARRGSYDLVITDIDMPRMNGIELVRSLKQDQKLAVIPVVIVSYKDREEDRMRGLEAGANYYLSKSSFHDDKLVEAVSDLIGGAAA